MPDFDRWFEDATGNRLFRFQRRLAEANELPQLVNVPSGCSKTAAVIWHPILPNLGEFG